MRTLLAVAAVLIALTGCGAASTPTESPTITVIADPAQGLCLPKGVPGNCWLPLFPMPVMTNSAVNQNETCNNESRDQSACWPQPGTELKATCLAEGADRRPWYGIDVPRQRVFNQKVLTDQPDGPIRAYVSTNHAAIKDNDKVGDLIAC